MQRRIMPPAHFEFMQARSLIILSNQAAGLANRTNAIAGAAVRLGRIGSMSARTWQILG